MDQRPPDSRPKFPRLAGMGFEFAAAVVGFLVVGLWIDHRYETGPWGLVICVSLGVLGGMYNLIRQALIATRNRDRETGTSSPAGKEKGS